jgi:hypothetical protein
VPDRAGRVGSSLLGHAATAGAPGAGHGRSGDRPAGPARHLLHTRRPCRRTAGPRGTRHRPRRHLRPHGRSRTRADPVDRIHHDPPPVTRRNQQPRSSRLATRSAGISRHCRPRERPRYLDWAMFSQSPGKPARRRPGLPAVGRLDLPACLVRQIAPRQHRRRGRDDRPADRQFPRPDLHGSRSASVTSRGRRTAQLPQCASLSTAVQA